MRRQDIVVGEIYWARVGSRVAPIRIDREVGKGRWVATTQDTDREIKVSSARVRPAAHCDPAEPHPRAPHSRPASERESRPTANPYSYHAQVASVMLGDATAEDAADRCALLCAVQTAITCRKCGSILDAARAVLWEPQGNGPMAVLCARCHPAMVSDLEARTGPEKLRAAYRFVGAQ